MLGGIGTIGFGVAMSQRTQSGAYVDAMLTAYRRTLRKTMEQARSMGEVVQHPEVAKLADTPDKAVVWGLALGLHNEVSALLARGLEEQRATTGSPAGAYYPMWLGSTSTGVGWSAASAPALAGGVSTARARLLGIGACRTSAACSTRSAAWAPRPPSSSSIERRGGGFGGGGGGGGGGGSGSF